MNCVNGITGALLVTLLASCEIVREQPPSEDYAAWSFVNRDGSWTQVTERAVAATSLSDQSPKDIQTFCPRYPTLEPDFRVMFWAGLLSAMAKFESNFNPETIFVEELRDGNGDRVISRGLLQLSIESAKQRRYGCKIAAAKDLHDPALNLSCGARILATWVEADGAVASVNGETTGGARYWSVLRASSRNREKVGAITRQFSFCAV